MHEAGAGLQVETRVLLLHRLQLAGRFDRDRPRTGLLPNLVVLLLQSVDTHCDRHVQVRAFFENARDVRKDSLLNLSVRHQVNRLKIVVSIERTDDLRQVLAREWLAAGQIKTPRLPPSVWAMRSIS